MLTENKMTATLRLVGHLKEYSNGKSEVPVEAGRSVRAILVALGIPPEVIALVVVNDEQQNKDYVVQENDVVRVLAVIGGG